MLSDFYSQLRSDGKDRTENRKKLWRWERQGSVQAPSLRLLNVWKDKKASQRVEKFTERGSEECAWIPRFLS